MRLWVASLVLFVFFFFFARTAEAQPCTSAPCQNAATCVNNNPNPGDYSCTCATGFSGFNCQTNINECASSPCQGGGTCVDSTNSYTCTCPNATALSPADNHLCVACGIAPTQIVVNPYYPAVKTAQFSRPQTPQGPSTFLTRHHAFIYASDTTVSPTVSSVFVGFFLGSDGIHGTMNITHQVKCPVSFPSMCLAETQADDVFIWVAVNSNTRIAHVYEFDANRRLVETSQIVHPFLGSTSATANFFGVFAIMSSDFYIVSCEPLSVIACVFQRQRLTAYTSAWNYIQNITLGAAMVNNRQWIDEDSAWFTHTYTGNLNIYKFNGTRFFLYQHITATTGVITHTPRQIFTSKSIGEVSVFTYDDNAQLFSLSQALAYTTQATEQTLTQIAAHDRTLILYHSLPGLSTLIIRMRRFYLLANNITWQLATEYTHFCLNGIQGPSSNDIIGVNDNKVFWARATSDGPAGVGSQSGALLYYDIPCGSSPCQNGGSCTNDITFALNYTCACTDGYSGVSCQVNIDECASNPCFNGGNCVDGINSFSCVCTGGYTGVFCGTDLDECASSPCFNGTCVDGSNSYSCTCVPGYSGARCQTNINECASQPCANGGVCIDRFNSFTCTCAAGYSGLFCQTNINECASNPCLTGGTCVDGVNSFSCACPTGMQISPSTSLCTSCGAQPTQVLTNPFQGVRAATLFGKTADLSTRTLLTMTQHHMFVYAQDTPSNKPIIFIGGHLGATRSHGTANITQEILCPTAASGCFNYRAVDDALIWSQYVSSPLSDVIKVYEPDARGVFVFTSDVVHPIIGAAAPGSWSFGLSVLLISNDFLIADGPFFADNSGGQFYFIFQRNRTSAFSSRWNYLHAIPLTSTGDGVSLDVDSTWFVRVISTGSTFIDIYKFNGTHFAPFQTFQTSGITRITNSASQVFALLPASGVNVYTYNPNTNLFSTSGQSLGFLTPSDENAVPGFSVHSRTFVNFYRKKFDPAPYTGHVRRYYLQSDNVTWSLASDFVSFCLPPSLNILELQDTSAIEMLATYDNKVLWGRQHSNAIGTLSGAALYYDTPCGSDPCQNGATCTNDITQIHYYNCSCVAGYSGVNCQTEIDECSSAPCRNGGTCADNLNGFSCSCVPGFSGTTCQTDINECASSPCDGGGVCADRVNGFNCTCFAGFSGSFCQTNVNECASAPCVNGGTCADQIDGYMCACVAGYSGSTCETNVNECASTPCFHGGTCTDALNGYACICAAGYSGTHCQTDVDECASTPCKNGGTCSDHVNGFTCACAPGYSGITCQTDINECASTPCFNGGSCTDVLNGYLCTCVDGYSGIYCQTDIDECASSPCTGGGTCMDLVNSFSCACPPGLVGNSCGVDFNECAPSYLCTKNSFYRVDPDTGLTSVINPAFQTLTDCSGLIQHHGQLLAIGRDSGSSRTALFVIDPATGLDTFIGYSDQGSLCTGQISDLAVQFMDGTVYAFFPSTRCLGTLDPYTGVVSDIALTGLAQLSSGGGLEFNRTGDSILYLTHGANLYTLDLVTAAPTLVAVITDFPEPCGRFPSRINALSTSHITGTIYAHLNCGGGISYLLTLDRETGVFGPVGAPTPFGTDGITVFGDPIPPQCQNGTCITAFGADIFTCTCDPGYAGNICEININECASQPCENGASCVDLVNGFSCTCVAGYSGILCQTEVNECSSSPCVNSGVCADFVNFYVCTCPPGYSGARCQTEIDECGSSPCTNGGTCFDFLNSYVCSCAPGFSGVHCETNINECASQPCSTTPGTSCSDAVNGFVCICSAGFSGALCQTEVNECSSQPCANSGVCTDFVNSYVCTCPAGYSGVHCETNVNECSSNPCEHGGTCADFLNSYICSCMPGFSGVSCETEINECASHPCENGGTCADTVNGFLCTCSAGFSGVQCQTQVNECASQPCKNGATCVDFVNSYSCTCPAGYSGVHCQTDVNECASAPCLNGGTCIDFLNVYNCSCLPGSFLPVCNLCGPGSFSASGTETTCVNCIPGQFSPGLGGSACLACAPNTFNPLFGGTACADCDSGFYSNVMGATSCQPCPPGFTGVGCVTNVDECASAPCENAGLCVDGINGYQCVCVPGFSGPICATNVNECGSNPCENGATCMDQVSGFSCACAPGYSGITCAANINECSSSPCENAGTCVDGVNSFSCICTHGFSGVRCQTNVNECASQPCATTAGTVCVDGINGYSCTCAAGFSGALCQTDVNECASQPCAHSGVCTDAVNSYTCVCPAGYSGTNCQTDVNECSSSPCRNGGTCADLLHAYQCTCAAGFSGVNCDTNIDECASQPCASNGTCSDAVNGFACVCPPGFSGTLCQTNVNECASQPCSNAEVCVDAIHSYTCVCPPQFIQPLCAYRECGPGGVRLSNHTCNCTSPAVTNDPLDGNCTQSLCGPFGLLTDDFMSCTCASRTELLGHIDSNHSVLCIPICANNGTYNDTTRECQCPSPLLLSPFCDTNTTTTSSTAEFVNESSTGPAIPPLTVLSPVPSRNVWISVGAIVTMCVGSLMILFIVILVR